MFRLEVTSKTQLIFSIVLILVCIDKSIIFAIGTKNEASTIKSYLEERQKSDGTQPIDFKGFQKIMLESINAIRTGGPYRPSDQTEEGKIVLEMLASAKQYKDSVGQFYSPEEKEIFSELILANLEKIAKTELPTNYEDPRRYWLIHNSAIDIEEAARTLRGSVPTRPILGTLLKGAVNAETFYDCDSKEYLVIFQREWFPFARSLTKVVASSLPVRPIVNEAGVLVDWSFSTKDEDWKALLKQNPQISTRYDELIESYLLTGNPSLAPRYIVPGAYARFASMLQSSMEYFALGHEYGHIMLNHLSECEGGNKDLQGTLSQANEMAADIEGIQLMLIAMNKVYGNDLATSYMGADLFFTSIDIIERAFSIMRSGSGNVVRPDTHPLSYVRRKAIRDYLKKSHPDEAASALDLARILENISEALWAEFKPKLLAYKKDGKSLAPIWQYRGAP